jgi:DNA polymerase-3 subunit gamma/tau
MVARGGEGAARMSAQPAAAPASQTAAPAVELLSFAEIVAYVGKRDIMLQKTMEREVRFVRLDDAKLEIALEPSAPRGLPNELQRKLEQWTGRRWMVAVSQAEGQPTLRAQRDMQRNARERAAEADPRVQEVLAKFPGAKIVEVRHVPAAAPVPAGGEDAVAFDVDAGDMDDGDADD